MTPKRKYIVLAASGFILLMIAGTAFALSAPTIDWWVFGGGGGTSSNGEITMNATIGQPLVGSSSDGDVSLHSGYWVSGTVSEQEYLNYLPLVLR